MRDFYPSSILRRPYAQPINNLDATPARVEVFDDLGNFVAANQTYISNNSTDLPPPLGSGEPTRVAHFVLAGFNRRRIRVSILVTRDIFGQDFMIRLMGLARMQEAYFYILGKITKQERLLSGCGWMVIINSSSGMSLFRRGTRTGMAARRLGPAVISMVESLNRASRISGTVVGPDFFDRARPLSWATITSTAGRLHALRHHRCSAG